ncbi:MAG TPA: alkaline phosphatase family protein [Candidatus Cybelea sp.]|jgi:phospholipase C
MRLASRPIRAFIVTSLAAIAAGCGSGGAVSSAPQLPDFGASRPLTSQKIKHIVIVVQENRSFNDLFYGYPGAKTSKYGYDSDGKRVNVYPIGLETSWDIDHSSWSFFDACNGTGSIPGTDCKMNGFNKESVGCGGRSDPCPTKYPQYAYVPHAETKPYFSIANQFVLADQMYASNFDGSSFISHQYIISAQAESAVNYPFGSWGCPGGSGDQVEEVGQQRQIPAGYEIVCWDPTTLGDELDTAGISWAYYATAYGSNYPGIWSAYQAIKHIYYGNDWNKDVISPPSQFLKDVQAGKLRTVSWVTPTWANSDHAGSGSKTGPSWVASIVNTVGQSKYWNDTAMFIFWDDYGGWYDREPPAYVDYDGLGMRIPMLIVSPFAKQNYVSHVHYEHGSILKFVEDEFGLGRLSASDKRATSPAQDCFDFSGPPRKFKKIPSDLSVDYFLKQPLDNHIPDAQ